MECFENDAERVEIELICIAAQGPVWRTTVMKRRNLSPTRVPVAGEQTCNLSEWRSLSPAIIIYAYAESKLEWKSRGSTALNNAYSWSCTVKSIELRISERERVREGG